MCVCAGKGGSFVVGMVIMIDGPLRAIALVAIDSPSLKYLFILYLLFSPFSDQFIYISASHCWKQLSSTGSLELPLTDSFILCVCVC